MRGDNTGETYRLGDKVEVKLVEAAPIAGALRFELVTKGRFTGRSGPARKGAKHPPRGARTGKAFPPERSGSRTRVKVKRRTRA
jgi:ribonuclease R